MKRLLTCMAMLLLSCSFLFAGENRDTKRTFSKSDIINLADKYINNNVSVKNPIIVDVDNDGIFDILKFNSKGKVEFYRNTNTLEEPLFVLADKNYDNYEMNSFMPRSLMMPMFFADKDGDKDYDVFAVTKEGYDSKTLKQNYSVVYLENTMDLDHYTLITIILVLLIVALLLVILK